MAVINIDDAYILGETGAQVDKVTGLFTKDEETTSGEKAFAQLNIGTAGSNRNLLDNPWFTVNQRGQSSYTNASGFSESVDRWKIANKTTLAVVSGGVTLTTTSEISFQQNTEYDLRGETVTASVKVGGVVYSGSTTVPSSGFNLVTLSINGLSVDVRVGYSSGLYFRINVNSNTASLTLQAVKLELGSVSTLANDAPPEYETELIKCRGYFERIHSLGSSEIVGMGMGVSASSVRIGIPSLICHTIQSVTYSGGGLLLEGGGNYRTLTSIGKLNATPKNGFLTVTCGSSDAITLYQTYALVGTAAGGYIDISADL